MRPAAAVMLFCLWPGLATASQYSSVYTAFDLAACRQIEAGDGFMYDGTWACKGYKDIDIVIASADARNFVAFGKDGMKHCAYRQTFTPGTKDQPKGDTNLILTPDNAYLKQFEGGGK